MLTEHCKIKQLDVHSKKSSSNNDLLLIEKKIHIEFNGMSHTVYAIPQFIEFLIQGLFYFKTNALTKIGITTTNHDTFTIDTTREGTFDLVPQPITDLSIQPHLIVDWVREFRNTQSIYHQTGATQSMGILLTNGQVYTIECISFYSCFLKLIGAMIKKDVTFHPILFLSHRLSLADLFFLDILQPDILISQSALTAPVLSQLVESRCTVYGFCRKNKFNRYSNFHL